MCNKILVSAVYIIGIKQREEVVDTSSLFWVNLHCRGPPRLQSRNK